MRFTQLCTGLDSMPVEDANKEWREADSPYVAVARIRLPRQEAYSKARQQYVEGLSFSPAHSLEAHRPLGTITRARLQAYAVLSAIRRRGNHQPLEEPTAIAQVPAWAGYCTRHLSSISWSMATMEICPAARVFCYGLLRSGSGSANQVKYSQRNGRRRQQNTAQQKAVAGGGGSSDFMGEALALGLERC